jgi:hypothetical protein
MRLQSVRKLGFELDDPKLKAQQGKEIYLIFKTSRLVLGSTHPPIQWVLGALS